MDCVDLNKLVLKCKEEDIENRECKEILDKFQFECEKHEEQKGWFGFLKNTKDVNEDNTEDNVENKAEDKKDDKEEDNGDDDDDEDKKDEDKFAY